MMATGHEDEGQQRQLVLYIDQGRNFLDRHVSPFLAESCCLVVSASLLHNTLETGRIAFEETPSVKEELVFGLLSNDLRRLVHHGEHVHVKVFAENAAKERRLVGAMALKVSHAKSAFAKSDEGDSMHYRCVWHTLKNLIRPMDTAPQLLTALCIDSQRVVRAKYDARGFFVVGKVEEATHLFQFCLQRIVAQNLNLVLPHTYSRPEGARFKLVFDFFGIRVQSEEFSNLREPEIAADSACAKIVSNAKDVVDYFSRHVEPIVFRLVECEGEEDLASAVLDVAKVFDVTNIEVEPASMEKVVFFDEYERVMTGQRRRSNSSFSLQSEAFVGISLELMQKRAFNSEEFPSEIDGVKMDETDDVLNNEEHDGGHRQVANLRRQLQGLQMQLVKSDESHQKEVDGLLHMIEKLRAELKNQSDKLKAKNEEANEREKKLRKRETLLVEREQKVVGRESKMRSAFDELKSKLALAEVESNGQIHELKEENQALKEESQKLKRENKDLKEENHELRRKRRRQSNASFFQSISGLSDHDWTPDTAKRQRLRFLRVQRASLLKTRCYSSSDPVIKRIDDSISELENSMDNLEFDH